jgi:glycosyltransferase involved in cell wall biosynthesis
MTKINSNKLLRLLMIVPTYYGVTGEAVNERQLSLGLAKCSKLVYVITSVGFKQIFTSRRKELKVDLPRNIKVIPIIMMPRPHPFLTPFVTITHSFFVALIAIIFKMSNIIDAVYVRSSLLAVGPLVLKKQLKNLATVIPGFIGDELASKIKNRTLGSFTKSLCDMIDQWVIRRTEILLVHGSFFGEKLRQKYRFSDNKYLLSVAPGVDLREIEKIRGRVKPTGGVRIGFVGSLVWWQGVDILIKALQLVQKRHTEAQLYIVGDGPMLSPIKSLIERCGVNAVLTGSLTHEKALELLSTFYALVIPSRSASNTETKLPMKMVEAFALGIPVLITKHEVIVSLFKNGDEVLYIDDLSPSSVAEKILTIIERPEIRERLSEKGLKLTGNFDYDKIAEKLTKVLDEFIHRNRP